MAKRKRDANGNIIYTEADMIYNERRRAKRRLERMKRDLGKNQEGKQNFEQQRLRTDIQRVERAIKRSYQKVNPEGYKGVVRTLKRENDMDFTARQTQRLENTYRKEFKKIQKQGFAEGYGEDVYVNARIAGVEWFGNLQGDTLNVITGEVVSGFDRDRYESEVRQIQTSQQWQSTNIQPTFNREEMEQNMRRAQQANIERLEEERWNRSQNSLFNLAMKYAVADKDVVIEDSYGLGLNMRETLITEDERRRFFALVQPFRAEHPELDPKELYNAMYMYIKVHDPENANNINNFFDVFNYVLTNPKWGQMTFRYEEWMEDLEYEDIPEVKYQELSQATAKIAQRIRQG